MRTDDPVVAAALLLIMASLFIGLIAHLPRVIRGTKRWWRQVKEALREVA